MTNAWLTCSRLRSRHFEVVGERENGRARGRQATRAVSFTIDKSISKNQKQRNIQRFFNATASVNLSDYNYCTYFYLISVFLHTVLYFIKKWFIVTNFTLPRLFRNPAISNFFPFPLGLRNSGVQLYWSLESRIQLKESGIPLTIAIQNPSSTDKDWNSVPRIHNPRRGIQNPS